MTKRITALLLSLFLLFPLAACKKITPTHPDDLPETRKSTGAEYAYFAADASNTALRIRMPIEWEFDGENGVYTIKEGDVEVGTVTLGEPKTDTESMTEAKSETHNDVLVKTHIGVLEKNGEKQACYRICYSFKDDEGESRAVTLEILESSMDQKAFEWLSNPTPMPIKDYHKLPSISLEGGNGKKNIALFGNSFLYNGFSGIGIILNDMFTQSKLNYTASAISIGNASITTYATSTDTVVKAAMNTIKRGDHSIVFMCGLYSDSDVENLQTIYDACKSSNTQLVIFPAHNENSPQLENAMAKYPDLICLNWRDELDALIEAGVAKSDFCEKDAHSHSKALAGYVGARMIYKSLFGEEPPRLSRNCDVITQETVDEKLGDIAISPKVLIPQKKICYLK